MLGPAREARVAREGRRRSGPLTPWRRPRGAFACRGFQLFTLGTWKSNVLIHLKTAVLNRHQLPEVTLMGEALCLGRGRGRLGAKARRPARLRLCRRSRPRVRRAWTGRRGLRRGRRAAPRGDSPWTRPEQPVRPRVCGRGSVRTRPCAPPSCCPDRREAMTESPVRIRELAAPEPRPAEAACVRVRLCLWPAGRQQVPLQRPRWRSWKLRPGPGQLSGHTRQLLLSAETCPMQAAPHLES